MRIVSVFPRLPLSHDCDTDVPNRFGTWTRTREQLTLAAGSSKFGKLSSVVDQGRGTERWRLVEVHTVERNATLIPAAASIATVSQ